MSRPDPWVAASGAADHTSSPASVPLRVVAERLSAEEARAADEDEGRRMVAMAGAPAGTAARTGTHGARSVADGLPATAAPGTVALAGPAESVTGAPGLPVVAPFPARREGLRCLFRLVSARRRAGRHRPDTLKRGWSMFAPRRPRSRWSGR